MKVIVDTNIVLDVLLARTPFVDTAAEVFALVERSRMQGLLYATTFTTVDYLLQKAMPAKEARAAIGRLLSLFDVAPVTRAVIENALKSRMDDFEDAVLDQAGRLAGAEAVLTRNVRDFARSSLPASDPIEFLARYRAP